MALILFLVGYTILNLAAWGFLTWCIVKLRRELINLEKFNMRDGD